MKVNSAISAEKGKSIVGTARKSLAKDLAARYQAGQSIRELAAETGRSYGFIHRVLVEAGIPLRRRGHFHRSS